MTRSDAAKYLERLGVNWPGRPTVETLFQIQRAHVERIPYENIDGYLEGHLISMKPSHSVQQILSHSVRQILSGRGGVCFQTNVALAMLLRTLGYEADNHWGEVRFTREEDVADSEVLSGGHVALTVRAEGETWLLDAGMGDAIYEPLPLREGRYRQDPFSFGLERWRRAPDGWRFRNDPSGSFVSMVFTTQPTSLDVFKPVAAGLAQSSRFSRTLTVQRRQHAGADVLRGRILTRIDANGRSRKVIQTEEEWFECLTGLFGLTLPELSPAQREALWHKVLPRGRQLTMARADV